MSAFLFPPAERALYEIRNYTVANHGKKQAKAYLSGFYQHLDDLDKGIYLWRSLPELEKELKIKIYFSRYKQHYLFFRRFDSGKLGVMSITHVSMNTHLWLLEDLTELKL